MKILITGKQGFIARNLFERLEPKHAVKSTAREDLDLLDASKVLACLRENRFDVVIHTATYDAAPTHSTKDPSKVLTNNLRMFFNLAGGSDFFDKMIYFGSGAEFSREHWKPRMEEDYFDQNVPSDQYGLSKYVMNQFASQSDKIYNLRLFGVFGKHDDWRTRLIPSLCHMAALGKDLEINQNKAYDFMDVRDLVRIVEWFMENDPKLHAYNVCTGRTIDFESVAKRVRGLSGKDLKIKIKEKGMGQEYSGDNSLLLQELGAFEFTPIDESLKYLYNWYKNGN
jgi:GDP-L-fucose synthase